MADNSRPEQTLIRMLNENKQLFLSTRKAMGASEAVGLACLPKAHENELVALLTRTRKYQGQLLYNIRSCSGPLEIPFCPEDNDHIIVDSNYNLPHTALISLHYGNLPDKKPFDEGIIAYPNELLTGLNAHELAHWLFQCGNIEKEQRNKMDREAMKTMKECDVRFSEENCYESLFHELVADYIAASHGFEQESLETIKYLREKLCAARVRLSTFDFWGLQDTFTMIDVRIKALEKYSC